MSIPSEDDALHSYKYIYEMKCQPYLLYFKSLKISLPFLSKLLLQPFYLCNWLKKPLSSNLTFSSLDLCPLRIQVCNAAFPLKYSSRVHITHPLLFDGRKLYCVIKNSNRLSQKTTTAGKDNRDRAESLLPRLSSTRLHSKKGGMYFHTHKSVPWEKVELTKLIKEYFRL